MNGVHDAWKQNVRVFFDISFLLLFILFLRQGLVFLNNLWLDLLSTFSRRCNLGLSIPSKYRCNDVNLWQTLLEFNVFVFKQSAVGHVDYICNFILLNLVDEFMLIFNYQFIA